MRIEVRQGDITGQSDLDVLVNAANTELWMGSGVAGAIARRGGPEVEREAVAKGPVSLGEAVETTAGDLPNRYIIHAAAMGYREEDHLVPKREGSLSSEPIIRLATTNSLALADRLGCSSIGFPALATGVGGFPVDECASVIIGAARDYLREHPDTGIERVVFVLFGESDYATFERELEKTEAR